MSIQKPMTAREKAYRKAQDERWKNMTPEEKKRSREKSKPAPTPKTRKAALKAKMLEEAATKYMKNQKKKK